MGVQRRRRERAMGRQRLVRMKVLMMTNISQAQLSYPSQTKGGVP
jgi:hypothetical protein